MEKQLNTLSSGQFTKMVKESAHQIWLAGLGAFAKAQAEGSKLFETLVKEGEDIEARTRKAAEHRVEEAKNRTTETWDKLEKVFEDRVSRTLSRLGVPTHEEVGKLAKRIEELNENIKTLIRNDKA